MTANRDALASLGTTVHGIESAIDSAVTLISGLVNRLASALMGNDLAGDITDLRNELDAAKERLATAVAANTLAEDDSDTVSTDPSVGGSDDGSAGTDSETASDSSSSETTGESEATDTSADEAQPADETEAVADGEEVSGDTESLPTGDDVVEANSDEAGAGDGVTLGVEGDDDNA